MAVSTDNIKMHSPSGRPYPKPLQASIERWAAAYAKFGGQDAFPHAKRVLDRAVDYGIVSLDSIGSNHCGDQKQLCHKLANVILAHVFRRGKEISAHFPTQDFQKYQLVVEGFNTFDALRENDLADQDADAYVRHLRNPSLGLLARMVDLTQYGRDRYTSEHELSCLNPAVFYVFQPGRGKNEYERIAAAAKRVYSPIADYHGYRDLAGDLMKISYYTLHRELHDYVEYVLEYVRDRVIRTQQLLADLRPHLEADLASKGYTFDILVRAEKNPGKVMEKVHRYLRRDDKDVSVDNVLSQVSALHDLVAFTIILDSHKKSIVTFNDVAAFREVASVVAANANSLHELHTMRPDVIFTDMVSRPKPNGYQSFHVDMDFRGSEFVGLEAIIRTPRMHNYAVHGGAAHYLYKGGGEEARAVQKGYRDVIGALERGRSSAVDTTTSIYRIEVVERINGKVLSKPVYLSETSSVADVLVAAGKDDLANGYRLNPRLSLSDKIGSIRRLEIIHTRARGQMLRDTVNSIVTASETPAARKVLRKILTEKE